MPVTENRQPGVARKLTREELFTWSRPTQMEPNEPTPQPGQDPSPASGNAPQPPTTAAYEQPQQATMHFVGYGPDGKPIYQPVAQQQPPTPQPPTPQSPTPQPPAQQPPGYPTPGYPTAGYQQQPPGAYPQPGPPQAPGYGHAQPVPPQQVAPPQHVAPGYPPAGGVPATHPAPLPGYPEPATTKGPLVTPLRVTIAAVALAMGIGVFAWLSMPAPTAPPPPPPPGWDELQADIDAAEKKRETLRKSEEQLLRDLRSVQGKIEKLAPTVRPGVSAVTPSSAERLVRAALPASALATVEAATPWLAAAITSVVEAPVAPEPEAGPPAPTPVPPIDPMEELREKLAAVQAENEDFETRAGDIKEAIETAEERLELLKSFDGADLILLEQQQSAVAVDIERSGDQVTGFVVRSVAYAADVPEIDRMVRKAGRRMIADRSYLARGLRDLDPGTRVEQPDLRKQLDEIWKPRRYVPEGVSENKMVTFNRIDRRFDGTGSGQHVFGYLVDSSDDPPTVRVATTAAVDSELGIEEFSRADVIGFPVVAEGVELLQLEPQIEFLDYAILRAAKALTNEGYAVHQTVALQMNVEVNPAFIKRLSAYSDESDISWFAVARDDELLGNLLKSGKMATGTPEYRYLLEKMAASAEDRMMQAASNLNFPLVTRDRKTMMAVLQEQRIRDRKPNPMPGAILKAMSEAAKRGNLVYAKINHSGRERRVVMRGEDQRDFQSMAQQKGVHSWRGASGGYRTGAYGGGYGYGGGGAVRVTPRGVKYGYGAGGGYGGGWATAGASAARKDYLYHDGQLYQSRSKRTYLDEIDEDVDTECYQSVVYAEQVAKRDAELTPQEFGTLADATHVLRLTVKEGKRADSVRYAVSLIKVSDGTEKQLGSAQMPIERKQRELGSYLSSGRPYVLNPGEGRPRKEGVRQLPIAVTPTNDSTRNKISALVVEKIPYPHPSGALFRGLHDRKPVMVDADWIVGEPQELTVGKTMARVPMTNRLRVMVHEILRRVHPPAGEVIRVKDDGRTALVKMIDAQKVWKPGERLSVERASFEDFGDEVAEPLYQRLPFDLKVNKCQGSTAVVRCDDPAELLWSSGEALQVGDRVTVRYAKRPKVAVRRAAFYYPGVLTWDEWMRDPEAQQQPEGLDDAAMPSSDAIKAVYRGANWTTAKGELGRAAVDIANSVAACLERTGVDVEVTNKSSERLTQEGEIDKLVHFYLVPKVDDRLKTARFFLGMTLYTTDGSAPEYNLETEIRLDDIRAWRPLAE